MAWRNKVTGLIMAACLAALGPVMAQEQYPANAVRANLPSVVLVDAARKAPAPHGSSPTLVVGTGSGFVVDRNGHILTSYHVVEKAQKITVTFSNGSKMKADVVKVDKGLDAALLKVKNPKARQVSLGDSSTVRPGMDAAWIYWQTRKETPVLDGKVSILNVTVHPLRVGLLGLSGTLGVGGAGAPVLDSSGKVVAMITAMISPEQLEKSKDAGRLTPAVAAGARVFAIPINSLKPLIRAAGVAR
ncbi:MAG: S1C family serine protease [Armatimonadota bacterium]|nr:S1C family serine protease [Armatimonadota bacterium]